MWPSINVYQHSKKRKKKNKIKGKTPTQLTRFGNWSTHSIGNNRLLTQLYEHFLCPKVRTMIVAYINSFILFSFVSFLIFFSRKNKCNFLSHCVRALSFTMISIGQYKNSSYFKYCLHVNIFVAHDELYFTKRLHVHSQKKILSHTQSHKQTHKTTTTTSRSNLWCKQ